MADMGVGGYASLMKTQKNPYERDIAATNAILQHMPQNGGVTGLEGLAKIPLMYSLGRDTANAQAFDENRARTEDQQFQGIMDYHKQKDLQEMKDKTIGRYIELAKEDRDAANKFASTDPIMQQTAFNGFQLKDKMDKNGWLSWDQLNEDGTMKTTYHLNATGLRSASEQLKASGNVNPTIEDVAKAMPPGFAIKTEGAAKAAGETKLTGHLVKDPTSSTGYSYAGDDGEIMTKDAPTPAELHPRPVKDPKPVDAAMETIKWNRTLAPKYAELGRFLTSKQEDFAAAPDEATRLRIVLTPGALTHEGQKKLKELNEIRQQGEDHIIEGGTASSAIQSGLGKVEPIGETATTDQIDFMLRQTNGDRDAARLTLLRSGFTHWPDGTRIKMQNPGTNKPQATGKIWNR